MGAALSKNAYGQYLTRLAQDDEHHAPDWLEY